MSEFVRERVNKGVDESVLVDELYEICDSVHSSCDEKCPVYVANGNEIPWNSDMTCCVCFKCGKAMLDFLVKKNGGEMKKQFLERFEKFCSQHGLSKSQLFNIILDADELSKLIAGIKECVRKES